MTSDQIIELTKVLLPALLAFLALVGTIVTGLIAYKSSQKIAAVQEETKEQTKTIAASAISTAENGKKADTIIKEANEIKTVSNGHLSRVTEELKETRTRVEAMQRMMDMMIADKRQQQVVAEKLAERIARPAAPHQKEPTGTTTLKLDPVIIEGTMETDELKTDVKIEGTLETKE